VLTPIWHSVLEMKRFYRKLYRLPWLPIWTYLATKELHYAWRSRLPLLWSAGFQFRKLQRKVVSGCNAVLPNSTAELRILCNELGVQPRAHFIVPPGVDQINPGESPRAERRDLVCAGRIEPRKNQLEVARAFRSRSRGKHRLLFYGSVNESHPKYWKKIQSQLCKGEIEYRGAIPQEEMFAVFGRAKGVILASFFETCGFTAMEAISCGAHACVSDTPYTREFYQDAVTYCDPFSIDSIARGIDALLSKPDIAPIVPPSLSSWDEVAEKTVQAYEYALASEVHYARVA
jgi:glycosyltransferase involved in cell wall biosynthesis